MKLSKLFRRRKAPHIKRPNPLVLRMDEAEQNISDLQGQIGSLASQIQSSNSSGASGKQEDAGKEETFPGFEPVEPLEEVSNGDD